VEEERGQPSAGKATLPAIAWGREAMDLGNLVGLVAASKACGQGRWAGGEASDL
jgi:hypothetical protein